MMTCKPSAFKRGASWLEVIMTLILLGTLATCVAFIVRRNLPARDEVHPRGHETVYPPKSPGLQPTPTSSTLRTPRRRPPKEGEVTEPRTRKTPVRRPDEPTKTPGPKADIEPADPSEALPPDAASMLQRILEAIAKGRKYSREHNAIVEAHFSIGSDRWSVTAGLSSSDEDVTSETLALAPIPRTEEEEAEAEESREGWRFLSFTGLEGETPAPSFVFFPNGKVQGGVLEMGRGGDRAWLRIESSGELFCGVLDTKTSRRTWFAADRIKKLLEKETPRAEKS